MKLTIMREKSAPTIQVGDVPKVNLLPREIAVKREQNRLFKEWGVRSLGAVVVLAIAIVGMFAWQTVNSMRLAAAQAEGTNLLTQISAKSDIQKLLDTETSLEGFYETSMATDLNWVISISKILEKFPEGSWLCSYDLSSGASPSGDPAEQIGLSGIFEICGPFPSAIPYLRDATSVDGVKEATLVKGAHDTTISNYVHTIFIEFDQSIYTSVQKKQAVGSDSEKEPSSEQEAMPEKLSEEATAETGTEPNATDGVESEEATA